MVKIYISEIDGDVHFVPQNIKGTKIFDSVIICLRSNFCKYISDTKEWTYPLKFGVLSIVESIKDCDEISISDEDMEVLNLLLYPPSSEFKKIKYSVDKELLELNPPLIGKKGFETFQSDAIKELVKRNRTLLDISCRHGKTYISIIAFGTLLKLNKLDKILIICRPEGVENFKREILRFLPFINEDDISIVSTQNREIKNYFDKKIIITNYTTFRLSCEHYQKSSAKRPKKPTIDFSVWGEKRLLICDEVQSVQNDTLQTHWVQLHSQYFEYIWGLSGSLGFKFLTWFNLVKLMTPNRLSMTYNQWSEYVTTDRFRRDLNENKVKEFTDSVLNPLLISYHDCIEQPLDVEKITYVSMSEKMRNMYIELCNNFVSDIFKEYGNNVKGNDVLMKFGKLSVFVSDPSMIENNNWNWNISENSKVEVLKGILEKYIDEENQKVIVWCQHPKVMNEMAKIFKKYNPTVIHGDSKTSCEKEDRIQVLDEFRNNKDKKILFTNKVLSTSITISECSKQVYFDVPMDSDMWLQSKQRIRGPKQTQQTETNILLFSNSIDEYIYYEILLKKTKTRDAILGKQKLSMSDLKNLLNPPRNYYI